jgi:hypothetical protein
VSVARGYGPKCWGYVSDGSQRSLFDDPADASDYDYHIDRDGEPVLVITDLDKGRKSVTNNMEAIIASIGKAESHQLYTTAIVYKDSEGNYDGVRLDASGRVSFYPLTIERRVTNEREALQAARKGASV